MTAATIIPAQLVTDILDALKRLREARIDGDPNHSERLCTNCYICASQRWLNILIDRLPREKTT